MPLSRLDNFLKNVRGNVLYVSPFGLDATDSAENTGNSASRPFITIQRALIEAARFSYQVGFNNDRFAQTTIILSAGDHVVDNRPGWIPDGANTFYLRNGDTSANFQEIAATTNFDLEDPSNELYKMNSVYGGVIIPRGVSIIGEDWRKTRIRPKYIPDPINSNIENSAIFRVTGGSLIERVTILDGNPFGNVYKDYTVSEFVPNYSHHKLTAIAIADGVNSTNIDDSFLTFYSSRTDLDMYYEKIGLFYGPSSGRGISPNYPSDAVDIQTKVDEYRIVASTGGETGISSIRAGDGVTATTTITVTLQSGLEGLDVDTPIVISGVSDNTYNGSFVTESVIASDVDGTTSFTYVAPTSPADALPGSTGATVSFVVNSTSASSPYISNTTIKSSYGMCGILVDGSKMSGFRSFLLNEVNGIGLQNDENAFLRFNKTSGSFDDSSSVSNLPNDPNATYKPDYFNYFLKVTNDAYAQLVTTFGVGYSQQYTTESGGTFSLSAGSSSFGQNSLFSKGFKSEAYSRDDIGYISNIVPPERNVETDITIEYYGIDVAKTVSAATTSRLYLYGYTDQDVEPNGLIQGYRVGAKTNDRLHLIHNSIDYYARIVMPNTQNDSTQVTAVKVSEVGRSVSTGNSITSNTLTLKEDHQFLNGETIRVLSDNARVPDGIEANKIYFAITDGLDPDQIQIAISANNATSGDELVINNLGGNLRVESRVSDKRVGDVGHPIQYDSTQSNWYVNVATAATDNSLYPTISDLGTGSLGDSTNRTFITRTPDNRGLQDRIYRVRFVSPSGSGISSARPPQKDFILQESNSVTGSTDAEVALQFSPTTVSMSNYVEMRNFSFIRNAEWSSDQAFYTTELPHNLSIGSQVKITNVTSANNTTAIGNSGFNGTFTVTGIASANQFTVTNEYNDPGPFTNNTSSRTTSLPTYQRVRSTGNYYVYDVENIIPFVAGVQDGVYYLTILDSSNTPTISPFNDSNNFSFPAPIKNLYPQVDRDNPNSDPLPAVTYADADRLGSVVIGDPKQSVTRQVIEKAWRDFGVGIAITDIVSNAAGTAHTIFTEHDHGLNKVTNVTITNAGAGYGNGTGGTENLYNATLINSNTGINATARLIIDASGSITDVKIMNGGCNYAVGDVLTVTGTATTTGYSQGTVTVSSIYNNSGDTLRVSGVSSEGYAGYNQLYRITGITTTKEIEVASVDAVSGASITGIGALRSDDAFLQLTGVGLDVSSFVVNTAAGLATVTTHRPHGLKVDNTITLGGASDDLYNGTFVVTQNVGLNTFVANIGVSTLSPAVSGTQRAYYPGIISQDGTVSIVNENFGGRFENIYAGITTVLSDGVSATATEIRIQNVDNFDFNIGDFLRIDNEILRIKSTVTGNPVTVFRGLFGTNSTSHSVGSSLKTIKINPVEFRVPSGITASGHQFEYPGYGAGNYSTALPSLQENSLTDEEQRLAQNLESGGGSNSYTGFNESGDYIIGNRKINRSTGRSTAYDTPIPTVTGEDPFSLTSETDVDYLRVDEQFIKGSLTIGGGFYKDTTSYINGPLVISEKLTSTSTDGIESDSLFLQGGLDVSRKYSVGISTPTTAGTFGDIVFNAEPIKGGQVGWTYTSDNEWYAFGAITYSQSTNATVFGQVGVATDDAGTASLKVGSGSTQFVVENDGVGIGTTANGFKLRVEGGIRANSFIGDGSGLINLANDSAWGLEGSNSIYPIGNKTVGVGSTVPNTDYKLHVGSPGVAGTDLFVANDSIFDGVVKINDGTVVSGVITSTNFRLDGSSSVINAGIITASTIQVGTGSTVFSATGSGVGIGTVSVRSSAALDVEGATRFKTYYEIAKPVSSSGGVVTLDLSEAQTFVLTTTEAVTHFVATNAVAGSTASFTVQVIQGSTGYTVDIDDFRTTGGASIPLRWPGGVAPVVTSTASAVDIYSFMTFDGASNLYGVVGGQNFS